MKRLFIYANGRLRTGRVAILLFVGLIIFSSILYKLSNPVNNAALQVKHLLEPQSNQPSEADKKKSEEKESDASRFASTVRSDNKITNSDSGQKSTEHDEDQNKQRGSSKENKPDNGPARVALTDVEKNTEKAKTPKSDKSTKPPVELGDLGKKLQDKIETAPKEKTHSVHQQKGVVNEKGKADLSEGSITLASNEYMAIFQNWQSGGRNYDGKSLIPLRVQDLKSVYDLFQMKPVAVTGNRFIDLNDGAIIPGDALDEYSSTVFIVDQPWEKWEASLKKAGIRSEDNPQVRYYMYDFVKNAIYARVQICFEYCMKQGLISPDTKPEQVDILGRAYRINRKEGGYFGVFVPITLTVYDGRTFDIDSDCLKGQPDIEVLKVAGLIR